MRGSATAVLGAVLFWVVRAFLSNLLPALVDAGLLPFLSREQAQQSVFVLIGVALMLLMAWGGHCIWRKVYDLPLQPDEALRFFGHNLMTTAEEEEPL